MASKARWFLFLSVVFAFAWVLPVVAEEVGEATAPVVDEEASVAAPAPTAADAPAQLSEDPLGTAPSFVAKGPKQSLSCIWCNASSQCQPICGGTPGSDFACIYDFDCGHRICVCL